MPTKALVSIGAALALAAAVQLDAQDKSSTHRVTITGCLQRADKARVEITGTLDTAGSVVGTSASVTEGQSGTIRAEQIKVVNASCNQ